MKLKIAQPNNAYSCFLHMYIACLLCVHMCTNVCPCVSVLHCECKCAPDHYARCVNDCSHGNWFLFWTKYVEGESSQERKRECEEGVDWWTWWPEQKYIFHEAAAVMGKAQGYNQVSFDSRSHTYPDYDRGCKSTPNTMLCLPLWLLVLTNVCVCVCVCVLVLSLACLYLWVTV